MCACVLTEVKSSSFVTSILTKQSSKYVFQSTVVCFTGRCTWWMCPSCSVLHSKGYWLDGHTGYKLFPFPCPTHTHKQHSHQLPLQMVAPCWNTVRCFCCLTQSNIKLWQLHNVVLYVKPPIGKNPNSSVCICLWKIEGDIHAFIFVEGQREWVR